ncbi:MAG: type II toxin-antitoxin system VapC family toxin [Anaeromyxobacteraceae bacterium]
MAAVDAGVLFRALEKKKKDRFAQACRDFWVAMLKDPNRRIIIPAPAFAEYLRGGASALPSTAQVYVVPFDARCAEIMAESLPQHILSVQIAAFKAQYGKDREGNEAPGSFIKYDAMIAVCAKRWGADRLVSIDTDLKKLAAKLPLDCQTPDYFYGDQVHIDVAKLRAVGSSEEK